MFFLLYRHTDEGVFDDFPKISNHFLKIFQNIIVLKARWTFSKFSENFQRLPKIAADLIRGRPKDVSIIHQQI